MTDFDRRLNEIFADVSPRERADAALALDIADQVTALRQLRGVTQAQLAEKLGKTQQAISKIENPTHAGHSLARLHDLLAALDATVDVTLVPLEGLAAYRKQFSRKPVLEARLAKMAVEEGLPREESAEDATLPSPYRGRRSRFPRNRVDVAGPPRRSHRSHGYSGLLGRQHLREPNYA